MRLTQAHTHRHMHIQPHLSLSRSLSCWNIYIYFFFSLCSLFSGCKYTSLFLDQCKFKCKVGVLWKYLNLCNCLQSNGEVNWTKEISEMLDDQGHNKAKRWSYMFRANKNFTHNKQYSTKSLGCSAVRQYLRLPFTALAANKLSPLHECSIWFFSCLPPIENIVI